MPRMSPIDEAYRRCRILEAMLESFRRAAQSNTNRQLWIALGVVEGDEKSHEARKKIHQTLDELGSLIAHVGVLDMAASLEKAAGPKLHNAVGAVRSARTEAARRTRMAVYSDRLISQPSEHKTLKALADLLEGHIDQTIGDGFEASREARNNFAHGTNINIKPTIDLEDARGFFNAIYEAL